MRPISREWVDKAEGDFATMERDFRRASRQALGLEPGAKRLPGF